MKALLAILILALTACANDDAPGATARAHAVSLRSEVSFDGYVVPLNASELRAPQGSFRVGSWASESGWLKLTELMEDGEAVKAGDVVAKFEFPGERAREYVTSQISNAEAQRERAGLDQDTAAEHLEIDEQMKSLLAEQARLDTLRRGVISERDWELSKITHQQAVFDVEATKKHRVAVERAKRAEDDYQDRNVERAQSLQTRYDRYVELFSVHAPHDGVLRHANHRNYGRKVQKGDGMPTGMSFASLARDREVEVQFFVPEALWRDLDEDATYVVSTPDGNLPIVVQKVEEFPQELGFLKSDDKLPNARERAYVVWARFVNQPEKLSAGVEVRVRKR